VEVGTICVLAMMQKAEKLDEIFVGGSGETGDAVVLVLTYRVYLLQLAPPPQPPQVVSYVISYTEKLFHA